MKALVLVLLLSTSAHAGIQSDDVKMPFVFGFVSASVYDVYWGLTDGSGNRLHPYLTAIDFVSISNGNGSWDINIKTQYAMSKITIGILSGVMLGLYNVSVYERNIDWNEVVFGGLGGMTSVAIHF